MGRRKGNGACGGTQRHIVIRVKFTPTTEDLLVRDQRDIGACKAPRDVRQELKIYLIGGLNGIFQILQWGRKRGSAHCLCWQGHHLRLRWDQLEASRRMYPFFLLLSCQLTVCIEHEVNACRHG